MPAERYFTDNKFVNGSRPFYLPNGTTLINHAAEIPYDFASNLWGNRNRIIRPIREDYQVIVLPPYKSDIAEKIVNSDLKVFSGRYGIATMTDQLFSEDEDRFHFINHHPLAKHIYLIASPMKKGDLTDVQRVAWYVKNDTRALSVTAIFPFLAGTRQDKNVDPNGEHMNSPINIAADIEGLTTRVDSFMVIEPHSFATQTAAATLKKPLYPATPWKFMLDQVIFEPIRLADGLVVTLNPQNTVFIRPDQGRNIAAIRASDEYDFTEASFIKTRLSPTETTLNMPPDDQTKIKGKMCIVYDDEFATGGTVSKIAAKLLEYGAKGLIVVGVHAKFTENWEANIQSPLIKKIFISDSRTPVGNIEPYIDSGKIEVVSLESFIADFIEADLKGVNPWKDPNFIHTVLQSHGHKEC